MAELKKLATMSSKHKTACQLIGGSLDHKFFCTYAEFEHICVYSQEQSETPEIMADHPMNLHDSSLLQNSSLP